MEENSAIRENDLIQLDGTIDKLIKQLDGLNKAYASTVDTIKKGSEDIAKALKSASGATKEGRKAIDDSAAAADRYERAQKELAFAMSETGKQVAWLKAQTVDTNKASVAQQRQLQAVASSYDKIQAEIKELTSLYRSLSEAERRDASFGGEIIAQIREKSASIKALNNAIKPHIQQLSALQKAEQKLAYLQSEEGEKLLEVRKRIRELTSERKQGKAAIDPTIKAEEKLRASLAGENDELYALNLKLQASEKLRKLQIRENAAQVGSYEQVSASYARAKFELQQLNLTLPENKERIADLTAQLNNSYAAMRKFQESTGVYSLGVGAYKEAFTGVNFAVQQVVRELPSAAISLNTFFLAISNNIPILVDEINKETRAFKMQKKAIEESGASIEEQKEAIGELQKPISKIIGSLFSWQTVMVLLLTAFSMHGEAILDWITSLFKGNNALKRLTRTLKNVRKEMADTNANYGESMVTMRRLRDEYLALKTEADKVKWIKDNKEEWRKLNVTMDSVADAERLFVERTAQVKQAFVQRAQAAAAQKLAEEKYTEMVPLLQQKIDIENAGVGAYKPYVEGSGPSARVVSAQEQYDQGLKYYDTKISKLQEEADAYYDVFIAADKLQKTELGEYDETKSGKGGGKGERDFIEYIERMRVQVTKKSDEAITKLQVSEFEKRRKEALKNYNAETGDLQNTLAKNTRILDEYYKNQKKLTPEQEATLKTSNENIEKTLANLKKVYDKTTRDIALDESIFWVEQSEELVNLRLAAVKKGSAEEYKLRKQSIENQRRLELLNNQKLDVKERQDEGAINKKYNKQIEDVDNEEKVGRLKIVQDQINLRLAAVKEGSEAEYDLRKSSIKAQMEMEIAENSLLTEEEQQSEEGIRDRYNKQLEDLEYEHQMQMYDITLEGIRLRLDAVKLGSNQELDLVLEQIETERKAAIEANKSLAKELQQSEDDINAYYRKRAAMAKAKHELSSFRAGQTEARTDAISSRSVKTRVKVGREGSRKREKYDLGLELADINKQLSLADQLGLSDEQIADLKAKKAEVEKEVKDMSGFKGFVSDIANDGVSGGILGALGFNSEAIDAFNMATETIIENINAILEAEIEAAEKALELQQERVDAAQAAYDAEQQARINGYANNVETARKELEDERKKEAEKQKILEDAQKKQEAINSIIQTSSLITAAAQIWSSMSGIPIVGPTLAGAAIGTMFASFIVAKVKAAQVSQQYGEGGIEFLEGGSHASGNDIDLNTKNSKGKNMRAEGGEAIAIINKRNTAKYKKELPGIIESLNKGTFEDTYFNAFANPGGQNIFMAQDSSIDLSTLENDVKGIRKNSETKYYASNDGTTIIRYKNLRRVIKNS